MFNINEVIREMAGTMQNNYDCKASIKTKFNWAKRDLLQRFADAIADNKEEITQDYNLAQGNQQLLGELKND